MNQYEAMFLFDPTFAADMGDAKAEVQRILGRANAETVFLERWEERKLAYEIQGRKRGVYVLCYFKCDGSKIGAIERDAQLSESILRALVKRAEGVTLEQIERLMPSARRADELPEEEGAPAPRRPRAPRPEREEEREPAVVGVARSHEIGSMDESDSPD